METTPFPADSSSNSHSPRSPSDATLRHRTNNNLPSPWAQVVRGAGDSPDNPPASQSPPPVVPSSPEREITSDKPNGGNVGRKPAWNTPVSNGVSVAVAATGGSGAPADSSDQGSGSGSGSSSGVVMGASAWPALSESTRAPQKSSSSTSMDTPKSSTEGLVAVSQSQGGVTTHSQQPKQGSASANHNSGMHNGAASRQRSMKRGGGGGGNRQGGFSRGPPAPPMPPVFPVPEMTQNSFSNVVPMIDSSPREVRPAGGFASHPQPANDHSSHRGSNRRGNFGQHNRGGGRNNHRGGRRDQDHGNHDWNSSQTPHTRDTHGHPHMPPPRGFTRPPVQGAPPFAFSPMLRPYGNAMAYPDLPPPLYYYPLPPESFRGMPYFPSPPPSPYVFLPESPLHTSIVKQIDYYFSDANLVKDEFLRKNMDKDGWVPITLISNFPRVQNLTDDVNLILQCLRQYSSVVEVQDDKIRRREEWMKWIPQSRLSADSSIRSPSGVQSPSSSTFDKLATNFEKVLLEEAANAEGVE